MPDPTQDNDEQPLWGATDLLRRGLTEQDYTALTGPPGTVRSFRRRWQIVLIHTENPGAGLAALDLYYDAVLGRAGKGGEPPDVDLTRYRAAKLGTSRRHAMLRPTADKLFLIDLGSTNGTTINGVWLETNMAREVHHNDTIGLGKLYLTLKILTRPSADPFR